MNVAQSIGVRILATLAACLLLVHGKAFPGSPIFLRGDANGDGTVDLSDPICTLGNLFLGQSSPDCLEAADTNDDGEVNISDPIFLLFYLFEGGREPPPPFPDRGVDLTGDGLSCS